MIKTCKKCGLAKKYEKSQQFAAHVSNCLTDKELKIKKDKISVERISLSLVCKCGKNFVVKVTQKDIDKNKYKKHCSRSCANGREHSKETKKRISKGVNKTNLLLDRVNPPNSLVYFNICVICFLHFSWNKNKKSCSSNCETLLRKKSGIKAGLIAANSQQRRSKNEIEFYNLCVNKFGKDKVLNNEPIFNGWDADVIIPHLKLAILWNGKWHYEKITKHHSVEQVQNRDRIKIKEIIKCGYTPYIIKDLGKHNVDFVKGEFKKFKNSLI